MYKCSVQFWEGRLFQGKMVYYSMASRLAWVSTLTQQHLIGALFSGQVDDEQKSSILDRQPKSSFTSPPVPALFQLVLCSLDLNLWSRTKHVSDAKMT